MFARRCCVFVKVRMALRMMMVCEGMGWVRRGGFFLICATTLFSGLWAQNEWKWPEDKKTAQEKKVLYTDNMGQNNFPAAAKDLQWLLDNAPDLHVSLYIHGQKIYTALAKAEKDLVKKREYQDRVMELLDTRVKYFNDEANVVNRKALSAYQFFKSDETMYLQLLTLLEKSIDMNGKKAIDYNLLALMDVAQREKRRKGSKLTEDDILAYYSKVSDVMDEKRMEKGDVGSEKLDKIAKNIDKILNSAVKIDCPFVRDKLYPRLKSNPSDVKTAKNIVHFLVAAKCENEDAILVAAAKVVYLEKPTFKLAKVIAQKYASSLKNRSEAIKYFKHSLDLLKPGQRKARAAVYLDLARLYGAEGDKPTSRYYARRCIEQAGDNEDAYNLIGSLYMSSYEDCRKGVSRVADKAVYIAAYQMFEKAGNQEMMRLCKEQFPTKSEMFELGIKEGSSLSLECWVNESVVLQTP